MTNQYIRVVIIALLWEIRNKMETRQLYSDWNIVFTFVHVVCNGDHALHKRKTILLSNLKNSHVMYIKWDDFIDGIVIVW